MLFFVYLEARLHQEGANKSQQAQSTWNTFIVIYTVGGVAQVTDEMNQS
jgi:hypothetical protein